MIRGTAQIITNMMHNSTKVWVTTTKGASANCAGNASTNGKITSEFLVTPLKTTARWLATSSAVTREMTVPKAAMTAAKTA